MTNPATAPCATPKIIGCDWSDVSVAGKRILLSTLSGHDKGEGRFYREVLTRLGCDAWRISAPAHGGDIAKGIHAEPGFAFGTSVEALAQMFGGLPDVFLYVEPLGLIPEGMERAPFPTACVLNDCHRDLPSRLRLARFFDHVFLYQRNYAKHFGEHPPDRVHWMPYACDLEFFRRLECSRDLDVAFVGEHFGSNSDRARVMNALASRFRVNEQRWYLQEEIPGVYSRAKIVVNLPLGDDLNFRFFEALSCGAMLVTRRVDNGQEDLFQEGKHFVAFETEAELFELVGYYLRHDSERENIAVAGRREVMSRHSLELRLAGLLSAVLSVPAPAAPIRRMSESEIDRLYAWLYEYWCSANAGARLIATARKAGRPWLPLVLPAFRSLARNAIR